MWWILGYLLVGLVCAVTFLVFREESLEFKEELNKEARETGLTELQYTGLYCVVILLAWPYTLVKLLLD